LKYKYSVLYLTLQVYFKRKFCITGLLSPWFRTSCSRQLC